MHARNVLILNLDSPFLPLQMMTGLECGHMYCTSCWTSYITTKIMDEGASQSIECPGCVILVDDQTVMRLVKDAKVRLKYQHLITNSFVEVRRGPDWRQEFFFVEGGRPVSMNRRVIKNEGEYITLPNIFSLFSSILQFVNRFFSPFFHLSPVEK